jgi:exonuclease SbcC
MITLKSVALTNFLSHESTKLEFAGKEALLIDGKSGSGKSSVVDAIIWALYGVSRSENKSLIRFGQKSASVVLTLNNGDEDVRITRTVTSKKHSLECALSPAGKDAWVANELGGVRDLETWIEKLIGASYTLFTNSVAYVQGSPESFVSQSAPRRKELLLEIVKTADFDSLYEKAREHISGLMVTEAKVTGELNMFKSSLEAAEKTIRETELNGTKLLDVNVEIGAKTKLLDEATERLNIIATQGASVKMAQKVVEQAKMELVSCETAISEVTSAKEAIGVVRSDISLLADAPTMLGEIKAVIVGLESSLLEEMGRDDEYTKHLLSKPPEPPQPSTYIQERMAVLSKADSCPSKGECPHEKGKFDELRSLSEKLVKESSDRAMATEALNKWKKIADTIPRKDMFRINELREKKSVIVTQQIEVEARVAKKMRLEASLTALEEKVKMLEKLLDHKKELLLRVESAEKDLEASVANFDTNKLQQMEAEVSVLRKELSDIKQSAWLLELQGKQRMEALKEKDIMTEHVNGASEVLRDLKVEMEEMFLFKEACSGTGIKSLVIDYIAPALEEKVNSILSQLSQFKIRIDTQKDKASGEGKTEGLYLNVINDVGELCSYENTSGGEKVKIQMSIAEALASLQKCGFRLFDESITALDDSSTEQFMSVLQTLLVRFPQVIMISHINPVKDLFDKKVRFVKRQGVSNLASE